MLTARMPAGPMTAGFIRWSVCWTPTTGAGSVRRRALHNLRYLQRAQAPSSPLTGILAQAFAEPSFQSRPVGVGQIEEVIT